MADHEKLEKLPDTSSSGSSHHDAHYNEALVQNADASREGEHGNILAQYTEKQTMQMGRNYALKHNLDPDLFGRAAALARSPGDFNSMEFLSPEEKEALHLEVTKKWHIPRKLVEVIALGSMAAAVQGMDESVVNGATLFYPKIMGITEMKNADLLEGLVNSAPYLCCSIVCWSSDYWNKKLGRKWTIFWTCMISAITCIWQGLVNLKWYHLFIARFALGFGIGVKSATVPAYAAETTPAKIRGSLVMLWQFFTAVGIMFGYVTTLAFYYVGDHGISGGLNWRLMLASACIPALIVLIQVPFVPESPRWLMGKDRHTEAFQSLKILRFSEIEAARDCFYQYVLLKEEHSYSQGSYFSRVKEMFTVRRNRNGALGAWIVMFMQQFCGINVIAYYSSSIYIESGLSEVKAMVASWGFGMINFLFAIPAFYTIDTFGRRNLLLTTFPLMAIFLLVAGFGFWIPEDKKDGRLACITTGIYLFAAVYSSGEGPVPFTYSAEAFPLYIRDLGMGFATSTCWFFNFILAFTWPRLKNAFKPQGAFGWYAAWNIVGFFLVLWFLPETKGLTLEELDDVFGVSLREHAKYRTKELLYNFRKYVLRQQLPPFPPLYRHQRMAVTNPEWNEKTEVEHDEEI
ncbi:CIC11C00000000075 [Sungouiella intermedia]|uniref:CIC11C00000000075 n=1 Tax=Sungouiella intermedia TaxID=45354 RepID=A0A1L0C5M2_9ASCO|nr:CIC11C00000000075 [[Candida] intermedia]